MLTLSGKASADTGAGLQIDAAITNPTDKFDPALQETFSLWAGERAKASGRVDLGPLGIDGKGDLLAGAEAKASGKVTLSGAEGTARAFAGVKAGGRIARDVNGVGIGATAEGWAGPGVEAMFKVGDDDAKVELVARSGLRPSSAARSASICRSTRRRSSSPLRTPSTSSDTWPTMWDPASKR